MSIEVSSMNVDKKAIDMHDIARISKEAQRKKTEEFFKIMGKEIEEMFGINYKDIKDPEKLVELQETYKKNSEKSKTIGEDGNTNREDGEDIEIG